MPTGRVKASGTSLLTATRRAKISETTPAAARRVENVRDFTGSHKEGRKLQKLHSGYHKEGKNPWPPSCCLASPAASAIIDKITDIDLHMITVILFLILYFLQFFPFSAVMMLLMMMLHPAGASVSRAVAGVTTCWS